MTLLYEVRVKRKISCQQHINVWLSIMSGYGANSIFFDTKDKDWTSKTLANPPTLRRPIASHLCLTPTPTLAQSGRHMCITFKLLRVLSTSSTLNSR